MSEQPGALGPVVVTQTELTLLEAAHRRLLGEDPDVAAGPAHVDAAVVDADPAAGAGAAREARLSLVARGLLDRAGDLLEDDEAALLVTTLLDLRLAADRVLVVDRVVAGAGPAAGAGDDDGDHVPGPGPRHSHGTRLVHVLGDGACVEDLLPDGARHLYLLLDAEEVVPWVTDVTVPPDAAPATGPPRAVRPDRPEEIAEVLGRPTVLAELSVLTPGDGAPAAWTGQEAPPTRALLALGPAGCWVTEVRRGEDLPGHVLFRPVHPGWVEEWVRSAARPAPTAGRPEGGGGQGTMSG
ncbi:hypothetical protein [Ornithinimicrobium pekingense]|uniref:Uncharacterized protein n=1 Tax=Ornithinimicrobium pekingense TaxID=384677 RepID=A0ABQ2F8A1_9MICO|nr:hypothetical protein [Ornithinimicrobium pekingense]GGK62338.1 hypothetical protein GCM10011509_08430 [Ornithinimicrobium pekingense]